LSTGSTSYSGISVLDSDFREKSDEWSVAKTLTPPDFSI
jgi:hypothetical protein